MKSTPMNHEERNRDQRKLDVVQKILLIIVSIYTSLFVLEGLLRWTETKAQRAERLFYKDYYNSHAIDQYFRFDPSLGWTAAPNSIINYAIRGWKGRFFTDQEGFRIFPYQAQAKTRAINDKRVLILGDSFGFGMGAHDDETIDYYLSKAAPGITMKNVSAPGWSPEQYYAGYLKFRDAFHPTHVYMLITHVNDFIILVNCTAYNRFKPTVRMVGGKTERIVSPLEMTAFKPAGDSLIWDFRLFYRLGQTVEPLYLKRLCGVEYPYGMPADYEKERLELYSSSRNAHGQFDPIWRRFEFIVKEMQDDADRHHAKLSLVILPLGSFTEIVKRRKDFGMLPNDFMPTPPENYTTEVMIDHVKTIASRHRVDVLYPEAEFDRAAAQGISVYSEESHYGPAGNKIIADTIATHLNH